TLVVDRVPLDRDTDFLGADAVADEVLAQHRLEEVDRAAFDVTGERGVSGHARDAPDGGVGLIGDLFAEPAHNLLIRPRRPAGAGGHVEERLLAPRVAVGHGAGEFCSGLNQFGDNGVLLIALNVVALPPAGERCWLYHGRLLSGCSALRALVRRTAMIPPIA